MSRPSSITRHAYTVTMAVLTAAVLGLAAFLVLVALPDIGGFTGLVGGATSPSPSVAPSASANAQTAMTPIGIEMPEDANCNGCHMTITGTVGTREIPKLAHQLVGFRDCTACHANDRLVKTAPGHSSLHATDCLICHQVDEALASGATAAPMRPEHMGGNMACTSCHGVDKHAPLPDSMAGRDNCWVCHNGKEYQYLFESPAPATEPTAGPSASAAPAGASIQRTWALLTP